MSRRIFKFLVFCVVAFFIGGSINCFAEEKLYINGIDANFPPFAYVDKNGVPDGFDVKAVDWIAKKMGFKVKHQPMDWDSIVPSLCAKKIDMVASGMSITEDRKKQVNFTNPYWKITQVMVVQEDCSVPIEKLLSNGYNVGVQRGTTEAKWIKENMINKGQNFKLVEYDSAPLAIEDLVNGRIVAAAMDDAPAKDAMRRKPVKIVGTFGMPSEEFGYAVRKEDTELLKMMNEGLKQLMASKDWIKLQKQYELK